VRPSERKKAISDINSIPLEIAYTKLRKLFSMHDFHASAELAEQLIQNFNKNTYYWENIRIPKSRLYADAAVSWLHYAEGLSANLSAKEKHEHCIYLEKALVDAKNALWFDFRQQHIPIIERKLARCIN
jgi:hypothetical protein